MQRLFARPAELQGRVFEQLFSTAEISKFDTNELRDYELSSNAYRDIKNGMDTAKEEGRKEGRKEGREEGRKEGRKEGREEGIRDATLNHAKAMKAAGIAKDMIAKITGLSEAEIDRL